MLYPLIEKTLQVDTMLFFFLNSKVGNCVFDFLFPILTNLDYWRIPLFLLAIFLLLFGKRRGKVAVFLLVLGITLSDQVCNSLLKPLVGRIRPCNVLEGVHLLVNCTKSFSFPSSHATNIFTGTMLLSFVYPKLKTVLLGLAVLVSYSRIYVGVHYPLDVVAGIILGVLCAMATLLIYKLLAKKIPGVFYVPKGSKSHDQVDSG